jgi:dTDP-glucose 4,6-dehydratase
VPITLSNCSNNYGPFQFPEKLIPLMLLNAIEGKKLPVYGKGLNIRDWLHVYDHCKAVWLIMNSGEIGETYAIGGECEKRNIEVVQTICELVDQIHPSKHKCNELISFVDDTKIRPGHDFRYAIDFSKIQTTLGWSPDITFEEGLSQTIHWYLAHADWVRLVRKRCEQWVKSTYGDEF